MPAGASHHLAQVNIALPLEPLESELLAPFTAALDAVNARADAAPGFVWRLQDESGDATGFRVAGDERLIVNLSVWESIEALRAFVYADAGHLAVLRRRREWFAKLDPMLALWWLPAGTLPGVAEAERRLALLERHGPTAEAFTFREAFGPPVSVQREAASATD
jgi:hypothetical protein